MMLFKPELLGRLMMVSSALALAGWGCTQPPNQQEQAKGAAKVAVTAQPQGACSFDCPAEGIAEGNASISGVASVDAFFQSVVNFQTKADGVSAAITAELAAIRGDFGIAADADLEAELQAQITANVEGSLTVEAEPARCAVDAQATLDAQARCDAEFDQGSAMVKCEGSCEVEASAMVECSAGAELKCTINPPMGMCEGTCQGSCTAELTAAASCEGTCRGQCTGECSAYVKNTAGEAECSGTCQGMCQGSCEVELAAEASCTGECRGECTFTPPDGNCEGGIRAECEAAAGAMVDCNGRCEGNFEPPMAKAECQASAKADASINVECTPPRVAISYQLRAGANAEAQAQFVAAVRNLEVRLPALLAAIRRAEIVGEAGAELVGAGRVAVEGAVEGALDGEANLRILAGLGCAATELEAVQGAITGAAGRLEASLTASADLTGALGV